MVLKIFHELEIIQIKNYKLQNIKQILEIYKYKIIS